MNALMDALLELLLLPFVPFAYWLFFHRHADERRRSQWRDVPGRCSLGYDMDV